MALLTWGNVIEDFLRPAEMSLEHFATRFTGSWLFAWARAFATQRVDTDIIVFSSAVEVQTTFHHAPSGATVVALPSPRSYQDVHRRLAYPYGLELERVYGSATSNPVRRAVRRGIWEIGPYLATPLLPLGRLARDRSWSAILCQEYESPRFDVAVAAGRLVGLPVYGVFQGGRHRPTTTQAWLGRRTVPAAHGLLVGPVAEARRVRERYGERARIIEMPNPVDVDVWSSADRSAARRRLGIPRGHDVVAWHGRLAVHHKGLDLLIDAWADAARRHPRPLHLLMIGGGSDRAEVARLTKSLDPRFVHGFDEHIDDPGDLAALLAAGDAYVLASRTEGFPVALVEALATGLPTVATDVPGARDLIGDGRSSAGAVVPVDDAAAIADALVDLLGDPGRLARAGRAARAAAATCSLDAIGARLCDVIRLPPP